MKALVTGGAGFIGLFLARRLVDSGGRVDMVESFARGVRDADLEALLARPGVRLIERDLARDDGLDGLDSDYDQIWHLAAIVGVRHVLSAPWDVLTRNVRMLEIALRFARARSSLRRFLFTSTSEVYAGTLERGRLPLPTPESAPLICPDLTHARTSYPLSKIYGEAMCAASGVPTTAFRPHNVYGPRMGMSHVIPELMDRARKIEDGGSIEVFSVDHRRTFCYVDDAVELMVRAADAEAARGAVLNVGQQAPEITIGELAATVIAAVGKRLQIKPGPVTAGSPSRRAPDTTRIRDATGFTPRIDLDEGVRRTWAWYEARVFRGGGPSAR